MLPGTFDFFVFVSWFSSIRGSNNGLRGKQSRSFILRSACFRVLNLKYNSWNLAF